MHVHLQPTGGIAGDMFAAALLDAFPDLEAGLVEALARAGFQPIVDVAREDHDDGVLTGSRFRVTPNEPQHEHHHHGHDHGHDDAHQHGGGHHHHHRHYPAVVRLFQDGDMPDGVRSRALDIFERLGKAEATVHGVPLEKVAFHEVGAWDSIADVFSAAWLVEAAGIVSWSCDSLPTGSGRVQTAHGELAVPALGNLALNGANIANYRP